MSRPTEGSEGLFRVVDYVAAGTAVGTILGLMPAIAALFTIIWTGIRIWETDTVRQLTRRPRPPSVSAPD